MRSFFRFEEGFHYRVIPTVSSPTHPGVQIVGKTGTKPVITHIICLIRTFLLVRRQHTNICSASAARQRVGSMDQPTTCRRKKSTTKPGLPGENVGDVGHSSFIRAAYKFPL